MATIIPGLDGHKSLEVDFWVRPGGLQEIPKAAGIRWLQGLDKTKPLCLLSNSWEFYAWQGWCSRIRDRSKAFPISFHVHYVLLLPSRSFKHPQNFLVSMLIILNISHIMPFPKHKPPLGNHGFIFWEPLPAACCGLKTGLPAGVD